MTEMLLACVEHPVVVVLISAVALLVSTVALTASAVAVHRIFVQQRNERRR